MSISVTLLTCYFFLGVVTLYLLLVSEMPHPDWKEMWIMYLGASLLWPITLTIYLSPKRP